MKNDKKIIFIMITILTVLSFSSITSRAAEIVAQGTCGINGKEADVSWILTDDGVLEISGSGEIASYSGTGFYQAGGDAPWYRYRKKIKKIVINEGITAIGDYAFSEMEETDLVFPENSLIGIGEASFSYNKNLKEVILPDSLETLGGCSFYICDSISRVYVPGTIKGIGSFTFTHLSSAIVEVGEGCTSLSGYALEGSIRKLIIPSSITNIDKEAFGQYGVVDVVYTDSMYARDFFDAMGVICISNNVDISKTYVSGIASEYMFCGKEIRPIPILNYTVEENSFQLIADEDYSVEYENNVNIGAATVKINGKGKFIGAISRKFIIWGSVSDGIVSMEYDSILFDEKEKKPEIMLKHNGITLDNGIDYDVTYTDNIEEGIASVKITGKGNYKGEVVKEFTIYKNVIADKDCALEYSEVLFDASAKKPNVTVKYDNNALVLGKDYKVDYANNTDVGEATVTITGMGSYKGTVTKSFSIYKYDLTKTNVSLSYEDVLYDGAEKVPEISVTYDGKNLVKDKDYSVEINGNTLPGVATVKIIGIDQYSGMVEKSFTITALSIENADVALKESIYSYDGSPKTPSVDVKLGEKMLVKDTDYILTYENNIDDGTAHAVVTGTGIYKDVIKVSFVILPYNAGMDAVYPEGTLIDDDYVYGVTDDETNEVEFFCPANQKIKSVRIPATVTDENGTVYTVTSIGNKAFYKNTKITSVTVGNNVKSIEDYAFYGCKNVTSIKLGKNVEMVGNSAFRKCTKLTSITLPKALNALGKNAFYGCSKLKTITINANSVVDVKTNAIKGVSKKCVIKVPKKLVKKYKKEFDKKSGFGGNMKVKKK